MPSHLSPPPFANPHAFAAMALRNLHAALARALIPPNLLIHLATHLLRDLPTQCKQSWALEQAVCNASCSRCTLHDSCQDLQPPFGNCTAIQTAFRCTDPFILKGGPRGHLLMPKWCVGVQQRFAFGMVARCAVCSSPSLRHSLLGLRASFARALMPRCHEMISPTTSSA